MKKRDGHFHNSEYEESSIEALYKEYYTLLYHYGIRLCNEPERVEDFIQDIFLNLFSKNKKDIGNPKTYLLRSLQNAIYNYWNSKKEYVGIDELPFGITYDETRFQLLFGKDDKEQKLWKQIRDTLKRIPPQQQRIFYLFYVKGCSHKEIAEILGISSQTSMNMLSAIIRKLREKVTGLSLLFLVWRIFDSLV